MNKWIGVALVVITLFALGMAIHAQRQLRAARAIVAEDLSGNPVPVAPPAAGVVPAPALIPDEEDDSVVALQRQVAALRAERDKLKADLATAQSALVARAQNKAAAAPAR